MRYQDERLQGLFAALSPANRKKVIKTACRKVGRSLRKVAVNNLRATGLNHAEELSKGIRVVVFKREAGFRITAATRKANRKGKGERGMHTNRKQQKKPILAWAETGTALRMVKTTKPIIFYSRGKWYSFKTRQRGRMKRYGFIARTKNQAENTAPRQLKSEIAASVIQIAHKYGCS